MRLRFYDNQCNYCGKFCKPADWGIYFGYSEDLDPPEPVCFCQKCVTHYTQHPEKVIVGCWWVKPNFVSVAEQKRKTK